MAGLLSRFTTFLPNTTILSNDHNQELNRIVNLLNGTTTNLKTVLKTSDAGDPPLEVDQLGAGPILELFQGGILKASFDNSGNLTIANANPSITFDDTAGTDAKIDHDASVLRFGSTSVNHITLDVGTGIATFAQIPVLPASNPTTANQAARKQYVDDARTRWSVNWLVYDPSTFPTNTTDQVPVVKVPGAFVATHIGYVFVSGTASGSFTINIIKRNSSFGGDVVIGSMVVNSGTLNTPVESDVTNVTCTAGDYVFFTITSPTTPAQRSVSFFVRGYKLPETGE